MVQFFQETDKIIELGGGDYPFFRPNMDIRSGPTVDIVGSLEERFPLDDLSFDGVFAHFVLEHISWKKVPQFLQEVYRILKPNGKVCIVVPNLREQMLSIAYKETWTWDDICMLFGEQDYSDNSHKSGFSPEFLIKILRDAGFNRIEVKQYGVISTDMVAFAWKENTQ